MNDKLALFMVVMTAFLFGAGAAIAISTALPTGAEQPFSPLVTEERDSPGDTITEDQIKVYRNGVYISLEDQEGNEWLLNMDLSDPTWSTFTDTNSMDPVFDVEANTVRIQVPTESLQVGDIVSYQRGNDIIIHRIVHIDHDEKGVYFVLKGDNNQANDPGKVRPEQILGKVVAIFY